MALRDQVVTKSRNERLWIVHFLSLKSMLAPCRVRYYIRMTCVCVFSDNKPAFNGHVLKNLVSLKKD